MVDNDKQTRINSTNLFIDEYGNNNDVHSTVTSNPTRAYSSPLMGTSARAAKHRINSTDTSNQSPQTLYQNTQHIFNEQTSNGTKQESRQPPVTYDTPPRNQQQVQKVITKITTTTTTNSPTQHNQSNSLPKESSTSLTPVNRLLEQAVETQRLANNSLPSPPPTTTTTTTSNDLSKPIIFERTDQYRVVLDPANGEIRRTPSIPVGKSSHSTDIDQAQEQTNRFVDDHQAIQQLTRVLQEHNTTTVNEYKRLSSQASPILINTTTTTTTTTLPSTVIPVKPIDQTNQFSVIDALLDNPLGTTNTKQNQTLHARFNDILKNLKNSDYVNTLKQSATKITKKKPTKKSANVTLVDKEIQLNESMMDPNVTSSDQTILIPSNKKNKKSKKSPPNINYQVLDALISSPVSLRLPESYLTKYKVNPPLTQLSLASSTTDIHKTNNLPLSQQGNIKAKYDTVNNLDNIVNEIRLHGQQMSTIRPTSLERSNQPKLVYGYMDEQDIVLTISPSTSRDMPNNSRSRRAEPTYFNNRHILPEHEQHINWHNESKLPTTITRQDLELRDKRIPQINERTIPISYEYQYPIKISTPIYSNQDNVQLTRLPLSYYLDQPYNSNKATDYESESSDSDDQSTVYHSYKQIPLSNQSHSPNRPLFHRIHSSNRSPPSSPPLPRVARPFRDISPDLPINNVSRNYIEVFRDGENRPSEVYSLLFNESVPLNQRHSRLDQYNSDRYQRKYHQSSSPIRKSPNIIPIRSNNDEYCQQNNSEFNNYLRQSKSFDYRPLRLKLQREYRITPSLLVDDWEQSPIETTSKNLNMKTSLSSPDDVFTTSNNNKQLRWRPKKPIEKPTNGHTDQQSRITRQENLEFNRLKPQIRLNTQPIYKALALHSFYAQSNRELSFKKGDIILVLRRINDDWLEGEHQGFIGIFPLNHVELFPIEQGNEINQQEKLDENEGEAIVKYDFIPQKTFELQLRKGDKVILLRRLDDNWYEGRLNHIEGIFPAAYVETLREPSTEAIESIESVQAIKQATPESELEPEREHEPEPEPEPEQNDTIPDVALPLRKCQVLYDYSPQNPDELEIHVGDIINIIEMCDDGWYCGIIEKSKHKKSMEFGTFPGNYVKLLPTS